MTICACSTLLIQSLFKILSSKTWSKRYIIYYTFSFYFHRSIIERFYGVHISLKISCSSQICQEGFKAYPRNAGFPRNLTTVPELVHYVTVLLFNSPIKHTAVNFGQFSNLAFVPNCPCAMIKPPPAQQERVTYQRLMQSLPVRDMARVQIETAYTLSSFNPFDKFFLSSVAEGIYNKERVFSE